MMLNPCSRISYRLSLYPQMAADPTHGHHPLWALALVAVSLGESAGKAGPVWRGATFQW